MDGQQGEPQIRIGVSGWRYPEWRGGFFPKGLPQARELAYTASRFRALEINGTFYGLQNAARFEAWAAQVPDDFLFAVKGPRFITHVLRLEDCATPLANFMASGVLRLGAKLGPMLWQLPPGMAFEPGRIETFLALLPHDTRAASVLAGRHDEHIKAPSTDIEAERPMRHALEIRDASFRDPAFIALLRRYGVALVCADTVAWPLMTDLTSDYAYCRLHGSKRLYRSGYEASEIERWARRVEDWACGTPIEDDTVADPPAAAQRRDVFVFFDNTASGRAPLDAQALMRRLGGRADPAAPPGLGVSAA